MKKKVKIPVSVLALAKAAAGTTPQKKPAPPPHRPGKTLAREKVIAALRKLHPMD